MANPSEIATRIIQVFRMHKAPPSDKQRYSMFDEKLQSRIIQKTSGFDTVKAPGRVSTTPGYFHGAFSWCRAFSMGRKVVALARRPIEISCQISKFPDQHEVDNGSATSPVLPPEVRPSGVTLRTCAMQALRQPVRAPSVCFRNLAAPQHELRTTALA
jgi:hypothetical protein